MRSTLLGLVNVTWKTPSFVLDALCGDNAISRSRVASTSSVAGTLVLSVGFSRDVTLTMKSYFPACA